MEPVMTGGVMTGAPACVTGIAAQDSGQHQERSRAGQSMLPLVLQNVSFSVTGGRRIVDNVSFTIDASGCTVLLGPNGAGKTSVLKLCHGLITPTSGFVSWGSVAHAEALRRQAMVFQKPVLLRRSAWANIDHALSICGVNAGDRTSRINHVLDWAGLRAVAAASARKLSGGEQQILSIARAWALDPEVLLLDEPTANLDPQVTRRVEALIQSVAEAGCKVIITTHDIAQARRLAADVLVFNHGSLLEHTPALDFFSGPSNPVAARFINGELVD